MTRLGMALVAHGLRLSEPRSHGVLSRTDRGLLVERSGLGQDVVVTDGSWMQPVLRRAGLLDSPAVVAVACTSPEAGVQMWTGRASSSGMAVDPKTPMYAASVTKQFVGVLVAQQVLSGRLGPDDAVVDFLPSLPGWAKGIRVRHLLHHASGLPTTARVVAALSLHDEQQLTNRLVLQGLSSVAGPEAPAGHVFAYSNVGYVLLAETLVSVTGLSLAVLARQALFDPLGMTDSRFSSEKNPLLLADVRVPRTVGDGGLWTCAADLLVWLNALNGGRLGSDLTRLVQTPGHLDDGTALAYAWGVTARSAPLGTSYTHGGSWSGWSAKTVRCPARGTAVALLSTSDDVQAVSQAGIDLHDQLLTASGG